MTGSGTGRDAMLFRVFLLFVVMLLLEKSISMIFRESMSPRLSPVPSPNKILIFRIGYNLNAETSLLISSSFRDLIGRSSSFSCLISISSLT